VATMAIWLACAGLTPDKAKGPKRKANLTRGSATILPPGTRAEREAVVRGSNEVGALLLGDPVATDANAQTPQDSDLS
jgi:hypothetical protein